MDDIEQTTIIIRNAIRDIPKRYKENLDMIRKYEKEEQDLLHLMELVDLDVFKGFKAYKEIQKVRQERRTYKDENEQLKHVLPIVEKLNGQIRNFDNAIGNIRNTKTNFKKRSYRPRAREDLDKVINKTTH